MFWYWFGRSLVVISLIAFYYIGHHWKEEARDDPAYLVSIAVFMAVAGFGTYSCYRSGAGTPIKPTVGQRYEVLEVFWWQEEDIFGQKYAQGGAILRSDEDDRRRFYLVERSLTLVKGEVIKLSLDEETGRMEVVPEEATISPPVSRGK